MAGRYFGSIGIMLTDLPYRGYELVRRLRSPAYLSHELKSWSNGLSTSL
jgi:hypothetical protein